jgi:hypothetical protein
VHLPELEAKLRALLRGFPGDQADTFVDQAAHNLKLYICMVYRSPSRRSLLKKTRRLERAADELVAALFDLHPAEFELVDHVAKKRSPLEIISGDPKSSLHVLGKIALGLSWLGAAAGGVADSMRGTAQDKSRPLRFLVTELHEAWLAIGWPRPIWRGDVDPADPEQRDDDLFCDIARTLLRGLDNIRASSGRLVVLRPEPAQVEHILRSVLNPRNRS